MATLNPLSWFGLSGVERKPVAPTKEMGRANIQTFGGFLVSPEQNRKLQGPEKFKSYSDYASNVAIVGASIRFYTGLLTKAKWTVDPVDDTPAAKEYADFVYRNMEGLETSWERVVRRASGFKFSGVSLSEWTAKRDLDGAITYRTIETRAPGSITQWDLDENGEVRGFVQRDPNTSEEFYLPRAKVILLTDDLLTDSPEGLGLLRHCVESAERLKTFQVLEQRGYERDLRGTPIGRAPYSALAEWAGDDEERQALAQSHIGNIENFVRLQLKGSDTGAVFDSATFTAQTENGKTISSVPQWGVELLQGGATGLSDMANAIERLNMEIARVFNTEGLILGQSASSQALSKDKTDNLYTSVASTLSDMRSAFDKDFIGTLWQLNGFPDEMKPRFSIEDVAKRSAEEIATTLADLARAGLSPEDEADDFVRSLMGVPPKPDTIPTEL